MLFGLQKLAVWRTAQSAKYCRIGHINTHLKYTNVVPLFHSDKFAIQVLGLQLYNVTVSNS